jgi:surfeit locus 1 family protein
LALVPSAKKFFLMPDPPQESSKLWERLDLVRFEAMIAHPLQPVVLLQNSDDAPDGLVRRWPAPENKVAMHRGYAFQWFGMAVALLAFFFVVSWRKGDAA